MDGLLKKFFHEKPSSSVGNEDFNPEYSFAIEYTGPGINYDIPRAVPINIDYIPTASVVVSSSQFRDDVSTLPVIQPIVGRFSRSSSLKANLVISSTSEIQEDGPVCLDANKKDNGKDKCDIIESSGELENFNKLKGRLEGGLESLEIKNEEDFQGYTNSSDSESAESGLSSSSGIFAVRGGEEVENEIQPWHGRKPSAVTFLDPHSSSTISDEAESSQSDAESIHDMPRAERKGKKGSCYYCLKGNRFTEKEECIVCGAKYCIACVIRAMGSMPEGRKCITCIGFRIDESRRNNLGTAYAAKLPKATKESKTRTILEGRGPCQIVSTHLEVGGRIKRDASNGNTNVCINNREITKKELRILKLAGVPCEGRPSYWVSADGSYQEEGMNNGGKIWDKPTTKLACAVFNLPIPSSSVHSGEEKVDKASSSPEPKMLHKLLLVGHDQSGTSRERFEEEVLMDEKNKQPVNDPSTSSASGNDVQFERKTIYSFGPKLKVFADWLLQVVVSGYFETTFPAATRVYAQSVEELLKDEAFQATYSRRNELEMLPRVSTYFLDRAVDISSEDYDPSDNDILYAEGISSCKSLSDMEFSFPESRQDSLLDPPYQHDSSIRYQLIRVHPSTLGENCKLLDMFEDMSIILFCVALVDYDEFDEDDNGVLVNRMIASKQLFERIVTDRALSGKNFLLILNKFDLFEEKIIQVPLSQCEWFDDFNPMITPNSTGRSSSSSTTNPSLAQRAFQYVAVKFKRLFYSLTDKKLFVSQTTGMEPENVNAALRYAREIIKWEVDKPNISITEISTASADASSFL
ncbi:Extra-large guanine nucleotide-binding protein 2, partial [Cucurbita argyrosperma subsp. sororia]